MRGEQLISLIHVLSAQEKEELIQFATVGFHNSNPRVLQCLQTLCENKLQHCAEDEELFAHLFREEADFNDEKLRDLLYFSTKVFKAFIVYTETNQNKKHADAMYNNFLQKKGLFKLLDKRLKTQLTKLQSKTLLSPEDHRQLFEYNKTRFLIREEDALKKGVELSIEDLDTYYFAEKIKWSHELLGSQLVTSHQYDFPFLDEVLTVVHKEPYKRNKFISVYYLITLFYKKNISKKNYQILFDSVVKILPSVSKQEQRSLLIDLHNYAVKLHSLTGKLEDIEELHNINLLAIKYGAYLKNKKFSSHSALNIANVALRLEKTDWVSSFLEEVKGNLDDPNTEQVIEAMKAFQLGEFDKVNEYLQGVEYTDVYLAIIAKSFMAKAYFMQKNYTLLEPHLKAMEQYYRRNKIISESLRTSNLNFVLTLKKIMKHITTPSKLTNISLEIEGMGNVAYKAWIQNVLKQLLA